MSYTSPAPLPPEDDLDRLLARELPKLLPQPFPAFRAPVTLKTPHRRWNVSRVTLAFSLAALLGLGLTLGPATSPRPSPGPSVTTSQLLDQSTADGHELLKRLNLEPAPPPME